MPQRTPSRAGSLNYHFPVAPETLFRLELLLGSGAMDLHAISDVVRSDSGLLAHMVWLLHETGELTSSFPTVEECVVELGLEGMRECLRKACLSDTSITRASN